MLFHFATVSYHLRVAIKRFCRYILRLIFIDVCVLFIETNAIIEITNGFLHASLIFRNCIRIPKYFRGK